MTPPSTGTYLGRFRLKTWPLIVRCFSQRVTASTLSIRNSSFRKLRRVMSIERRMVEVTLNN